MIKFEFKFNGKPLDQRNLEDAIKQAALEAISEQLRESLGSIRDPDTGEFPTIIISGDSLDQLHVGVEGSARVRELVSARLELEPSEEGEDDLPPRPTGAPGSSSATPARTATWPSISLGR